MPFLLSKCAVVVPCYLVSEFQKIPLARDSDFTCRNITVTQHGLAINYDNFPEGRVCHGRSVPSPPLHEVFLEAYRLEVQFLGRVGKIAPLTRPLAGFTGVFLPGGFSKELCTGRLRADFQPLTL